MIRIVNETGLAGDTKVMTDDGKPIGHIASIDISIRPRQVNIANIDMRVKNIDCVAEPIFTHDQLTEIANKHGYALIKV